MAFCYALLKGRGGAGGYIRETGNQREVTGRDLPSGAACALYVIRENECRLCGTETTDVSGSAKWTAPKEGTLFLASGKKVLLWDGGDEAFLRASALLNSQDQKKTEKQEPEKEQVPEAKAEKEDLPEETLAACAVCAKEKTDQAAALAYPFERDLPSHSENRQTKESPPEQPYTLRPAGTGEPVDTLPE